MTQIKHVGRVINTGRKCIVLFRHLYDAHGNIADENNCIVIETERLHDAEHQDVMRIIESEAAQSTGDVYNVFNRNRLANGEIALEWLAANGHFKTYSTDNIMLTPDSNNSLPLDKLNNIVRMQQAGASEADINNILHNDTDSAPRQLDTNSTLATEQESGEQVLDDVTIAKNLMEQANEFDTQAKELRAKAKKLDPTLKKRRSSPNTSKKEPAN